MLSGPVALVMISTSSKDKTAQGRNKCPIAKLIPLEVSTPIVPETDRPSSIAQQETTAGGTVERPHRAKQRKGQELGGAAWQAPGRCHGLTV